MYLLIWTFIFVTSLFVLVKASDYFVRSAEKIGFYMRISPFIIGVTILAIGTSLPELFSSVFAVLMGSSEIVLGNVIGSNITNIFLILGLSAVVGGKMKTTYDLVHVDLPLFVGSAFLLAMTIWDGKFSLLEAILCLTCLIIYILYVANAEKYTLDEAETLRCSNLPVGVSMSGLQFHNENDNSMLKAEIKAKTYIILLLSLIFIYAGANYTVISIIRLSEALDIGVEIMATSAVALGTSLPELVVSTSAASKGKPELAIGTVMGSNIFNALGIVGISALFGSLVVPELVLNFALPVMLVATMLYFVIIWEKETTKWEGAMLIIFYIFFLGKLFSVL